MDLYPLLRPLLFRLDPETAHRLTFAALGFGHGAVAGLIGPPKQLVERQPKSVAGLQFKNPIGLAAGLDKNALCLDAWARLGVSHAEIGTVTPRPQTGNPKPRLFRLPKDQALINRMGFNNDGATVIARRLEPRPPPEQMIIGGNIGKNKDTSEEAAAMDYVACLQALHHSVDYFTVNVSSPNTAGLRNLQAKEPLIRLLSTLQDHNAGLPKPRPIFVKIAPDLDDAELEDIMMVAAHTGMAGLVATNTTLSRSGLLTQASEVVAMGPGGLSGAPLRRRALDVCQKLKQMMPYDLALISSGGIMSAQDAEARLAAGADLVQLYTGLIYKGPNLVTECLQYLANEKSHP